MEIRRRVGARRRRRRVRVRVRVEHRVSVVVHERHVPSQVRLGCRPRRPKDPGRSPGCRARRARRRAHVHVVRRRPSQLRPARRRRRLRAAVGRRGRRGRRRRRVGRGCAVEGVVRVRRLQKRDRIGGRRRRRARQARLLLRPCLWGRWRWHARVSHWK